MSPAAFTLPSLVARLGRRVPAPLASLHFAAGLELARRLKWLCLLYTSPSPRDS